MKPCIACGDHPAADRIGLCADCLRALEDPAPLLAPHRQLRRDLGLPPVPPRTPGGVRCTLDANECRMGEGEWGYCGLRRTLDGRMDTRFPPRTALAHAYRDPLPTNCCAAWFCAGSGEEGFNLAVFFYGCNFDCLYCQNAQHKQVRGAPVIAEDDLVRRALRSRVRCVCFFGGSPEPQFPFALRVARRVAAESGNRVHICWEWNGAGNPRLVEQAALFSEQTGGTVKFDVKACHPNVHLALTGQDNLRVLENFARVAGILREPEVLTATTLLVPGYVDAVEVEGIARFIAAIDPAIPYSLLVFHPDFALRDLPITPREQVEACLAAAERHLERVHVGNIGLLE
jgi:pyruvate formate lyase activating enzyme